MSLTPRASDTRRTAKVTPTLPQSSNPSSGQPQQQQQQYPPQPTSGTLPSWPSGTPAPSGFPTSPPNPGGFPTGGQQPQPQQPQQPGQVGPAPNPYNLPPDLAPNYGDAVYGDIERAQQAANQGNIDRLEEAKSGYKQLESDYGAREQELRGLLGGFGDVQQQDLSRKFERQEAGLTQDMINRGLYSSTTALQQQRGLNYDQQQEQLRLNDMLTRQKMDYLSGITKDTLQAQGQGGYLGLLERVNESGPDPNLAIQLGQMVGAAQAGTPDYMSALGQTGQAPRAPQQPGGYMPGPSPVDYRVTQPNPTGASGGRGSTMPAPPPLPSGPTTSPNQPPTTGPGGSTDPGTGPYVPPTGGGGVGGGGTGPGDDTVPTETGEVGTGGATPETGGETPSTGGTVPGQTPTGGAGGGGGGGSTTPGTGTPVPETPEGGTGAGTGTGTQPPVPGPGATEEQTKKSNDAFTNIVASSFYDLHIAPMLQVQPNWEWWSDPVIRAMAPTNVQSRLDDIKAVR